MKKLRSLTSNQDVKHFEDLLNECSFLVHLEDFSKTLPQDTHLVGVLLTLDESNASSGEGVSLTEETPEEEQQGDTCEFSEDRFVGKFVSKNVVNLSSKNLSSAEISLLSKGLNFVPSPGEVNISELKTDLEAFGRKLRLKWHFRESEDDFSYNPFKKKSSFNPPKVDAAIELYLSKIEDELMALAKDKDPKRYDNLTREERDALYSLMSDTSIIIKGADKESAIVVRDAKDYMKEAHSQSADPLVYTKCEGRDIPKIEDIVKPCLSKIRE